MPSLSELTDYDPTMGVTGVNPEADGIRRVYINQATGPGNDTAPVSASLVDRIANKLLGLNGEERYQLWPEKVVREGLSAAGDAMSGKTPQWQVDPVTGDVHTSPQMIEGAQAMSALAGSGGLAGGADGAALNAIPSLRPALKYKDRLYKGKEGQAHHDVIPDALYPEFQQMAMRGDDISHYNFGFVNDKGHFLDREAALKYASDSGLISAEAGKLHPVLTSTLLADSSKPGMAIEATAKANAPQFYSALEHNVNQISQGKMTGDQWLGTLANKPGVKPEELQWSGLKDYLKQNKGKPVSKEQIVKHLEENKTELGEVVRGYNPEVVARGKARAEADGHNWDELGEVTRRRYTQMANGAKLTEDIGGPKYSQYQVPGGENYREVLMTLPMSKTTQKVDAIEKELNAIMARKPRNSTEFATPEDGEAFGRLNRERRELVSKDYSEGNYKSSHWDEPNILAHMRMNDRTIDGKKSLHLEEVQSDWHQDGRKQGYKSDFPTKKGTVEKMPDGDHWQVTWEDGNFSGGYATRNAAENAMSRRANAGVPDAPFKKNWHELALKRAIREAAENGYDRLSWTAGEHHPTNPKNLNQRGPEADAADKGMQGFYNGMLPKSVEKLTGQKVKEGEGPAKYKVSNKAGDKVREYDSEAMAKASALDGDKITKVPVKFYYIDIPQSVKDTALGKGFPLYSSTHMFTPVSHNPFETDKNDNSR